MVPKIAYNVLRRTLCGGENINSLVGLWADYPINFLNPCTMQENLLPLLVWLGCFCGKPLQNPKQSSVAAFRAAFGADSGQSSGQPYMTGQSSGQMLGLAQVCPLSSVYCKPFNKCRVHQCVVVSILHL